MPARGNFLAFSLAAGAGRAGVPLRAAVPARGSCCPPAARILPGLRAHAEVLELATPLTTRAYTGNEGGALYGFSQRRGQSGPFRRLRNRGPTPGLYFASAWTFPGDEVAHAIG